MSVRLDMTPFLRIAACSYEGSLFGWQCIQDTDQRLNIKMNFGFNCCQNSLRAIAVSSSGKYLVCGGMDERVRIFDAVENRSMGEVPSQGAAVTCLRFFEDSYLFCGTEVST